MPLGHPDEDALRAWVDGYLMSVIADEDWEADEAAMASLVPFVFMVDPDDDENTEELSSGRQAHIHDNLLDEILRITGENFGTCSAGCGDQRRGEIQPSAGDAVWARRSLKR